MYKGEQNGWSSKGAEQAGFLHKIQTGCERGGGGERNDTRRKSGA